VSLQAHRGPVGIDTAYPPDFGNYPSLLYCFRVMRYTNRHFTYLLTYYKIFFGLYNLPDPHHQLRAAIGDEGQGQVMF